MFYDKERGSHSRKSTILSSHFRRKLNISQTPDHGINFDTGSVVKSTPSKDDRVIGWFKTMIQNDKVTPTKWPEYSQGEIHKNTVTLYGRLIGASSLGGRFARIS